MPDNKIIFAMVGGFCCCCLITMIILISIAVQESCSSATFHDLPSEYWVNEKFFSMKHKAIIYDHDQKEIGAFTSKPLSAGSDYKYRDLEDNVVAEADEQYFSWTTTFKIRRCADAKEHDQYQLKKHFLSFGQIKYDLTKNGRLIGETAKNVWWTCKPDVALEDEYGKPLAMISRGCGDSWFTDKWHVINYQPNVTENYVMGFIAYATTQEEGKTNNNNQQTKH